MTSGPDLSRGGPGLSFFARQRLPPLLDAFEKEIPGVLKAEDIEFIHRMRVASRRLRAALPLFRSTFSPKQYSRWMQEIASITRALGDARDADVQIAFLNKFRKKSTSAWEAGHPSADAGPAPLEPAIAYLLDDLVSRRKRLQGRVLSALDDLKKSNAVGEMRAALALPASGSQRAPIHSLAYGIPTIAAMRIKSRLERMQFYEPWVTHPEAVAEHHAMRIAAKKLRYTMEVYGPVYRRGLKKPHARVKKIQEILGDLHDCDVWIDQVTRLLLRERSRLRSGDKRPDTTTLGSLRLFLKDREKERTRIHRHFQQYWQSLKRREEWNELEKALTGGQRRKFVPAKMVSEEKILAAAIAAAETNPSQFSHHRTVTSLSLMLFDSLTILHELPAHDRCLLQCAGLLHDIALIPGVKRHQVRSAEYILSEESLQLDIADRSVVGIIAFSHRGKQSPSRHPLFTLLPRERQDAVLCLAALLRVANALDCLHSGSVQEVHCIIGEQEILCDIIAAGDVTREKERARERASLFAQVFGRELVIR